MNKPNIIEVLENKAKEFEKGMAVYGYDDDEIEIGGLFFRDGFKIATKELAVQEMIDALMMSYRILKKDGTRGQRMKVYKALKKAGCTDV